MGSFSLIHWIIVLIIVLVLFGRGKIAPLMKEFGSGIKNFKAGMEEEVEPAKPAKKSPAKKPAAKKKK